jgi:hypothetical protein
MSHHRRFTAIKGTAVKKLHTLDLTRTLGAGAGIITGANRSVLGLVLICSSADSEQMDSLLRSRRHWWFGVSQMYIIRALYLEF